MLFTSYLNDSYSQSINFKLLDSLNLEIGSETFLFHISYYAADSQIFYIDQNEPQNNGGKHLSLNSINILTKEREKVILQDAGNDINIYQTSFLLVTKKYIIISLKDNNILFFNRNGKLIKKLQKPEGYLNFSYLESLDRLVLIDYYKYHILKRKPQLRLLTIDLEYLKIEYQKEYFYESIQYSVLTAKLNADDGRYFFISEPLNNRIYKYDFTLSRIDSLFIKPLNEFTAKINKELSNYTKYTEIKYDSLVNLKVDSLERRKHFVNDVNQQAKHLIDKFENQDSLIDRIVNVSVINGRMYVVKKLHGFSYIDNQIEIEILDLATKKSLGVDIHYDGNTKNPNSIDQHFKYCLPCFYGMQTLIINKKVYAYAFVNNNFYPQKITSKKDYNTQFDAWMLANSPTYMILIYELQE